MTNLHAGREQPRAQRRSWSRAMTLPVLGFLLLEGSLLLGSACASGEIAAGYLAPASGLESRASWLLEARASTSGLIRFGAAARTHLASSFRQIALAPELGVIATPGPMAIGARAGIQLLQFDEYKGDWSLATPSPYLSPLIAVRVGKTVWIFAGATIEYQGHASELPNEVYYGAQIGVGLGN